MSVTTHSYCCSCPKLLYWAIILSPYTPPRKPTSGLVLCSGDDVINGDWYCSDTAPLSPLIAASGPPVKICPGSLYDGAALIAPEDGNNLGIWRPPCCGHGWSGCRRRTTFLQSLGTLSRSKKNGGASQLADFRVDVETRLWLFTCHPCYLTLPFSFIHQQSY